ncbi:hypothetical protein LOK49_LG02G01809 [Camellia lanceoleosa]|uniref:Uncharacterized protein n=1 Tax=Camellia lanceoleosa TaxID=1840588 RepID=A0ACC0IKD3_9ERIC|nr:hypothetical protein LOK49_LG02G01809 [Camellia lanceoleosa]
MEHMVFGDPITEETLRGMPEYKNKTTITRTDKARVALSTKDAAEAQAFEYIEKLKREGCECDEVITLGRIYNATGGTITNSVKLDFSGKSDEQSTYLVKIENGQCGVFRHGETGGKNGSRGVVVYCGKNKDEKACDWMLSWSNPNPINHDNKVFTEIAEHGHYKAKAHDPIWNHVHEELCKSGTTSTYNWKGCDSAMTSTRSNDMETCVVVDATVTLDAAKAKA